MDPKIGWLYAITCDMYEKEGILKLGYTRNQVKAYTGNIYIDFNSESQRCTPF